MGSPGDSLPPGAYGKTGSSVVLRQRSLIKKNSYSKSTIFFTFEISLNCSKTGQHYYKNSMKHETHEKEKPGPEKDKEITIEDLELEDPSKTSDATGNKPDRGQQHPLWQARGQQPNACSADRISFLQGPPPRR